MSTPQEQLQREMSPEELVDFVGREYRVPKGLRKSLFQRESGGEQYNPDGSVKVATYAPYAKAGRGIGQLIPGTAKDLGVDPDDPVENVVGSMHYLRSLYDQARPHSTDDAEAWAKATAGYFSGPGNMGKQPSQVFLEDRSDGKAKVSDYVTGVMSGWAEYDGPDVDWEDAMPAEQGQTAAPPIIPPPARPPTPEQIRARSAVPARQVEGLGRERAMAPVERDPFKPPDRTGNVPVPVELEGAPPEVIARDALVKLAANNGLDLKEAEEFAKDMVLSLEATGKPYVIHPLTGTPYMQGDSIDLKTGIELPSPMVIRELNRRLAAKHGPEVLGPQMRASTEIERARDTSVKEAQKPWVDIDAGAIQLRSDPRLAAVANTAASRVAGMGERVVGNIAALPGALVESAIEGRKPLAPASWGDPTGLRGRAAEREKVSEAVTGDLGGLSPAEKIAVNLPRTAATVGAAGVLQAVGVPMPVTLALVTAAEEMDKGAGSAALSAYKSYLMGKGFELTNTFGPVTDDAIQSAVGFIDAKLQGLSNEDAVVAATEQAGMGRGMRAVHGQPQTTRARAQAGRVIPAEGARQQFGDLRSPTLEGSTEAQLARADEGVVSDVGPPLRKPDLIRLDIESKRKGDLVEPVVEKPKRGERFTSLGLAEPHAYQHRDFGRVREVENQRGVSKGSVRVADESGVEHIIQRPNGRGDNNRLAVPVKERGIEDATQERQIAEGGEPEHTRVEAVGETPEAGRGNRVEEGGQVEEAVAPPPSRPRQVETSAIPDRKTFKAKSKEAFRLSDDQAEGFTQLVEARARAWAKENNRRPEEYIPERFAGVVKGGEVGSGALYQEAPRTPEFQKWFGDSKVRGEKGEPLVVYHGTPRGDFESFSKEKRGSHTGAEDATEGFFFSDNPRTSDTYAKFYEHHAEQVYERAFGKPSKQVEKLPQSVVLPVYLKIENPYFHEGKLSKRVLEEARAKGHDGVIQKYGDDERHYVPFEPTQIKSATGNRGTFDPDNPNILFQDKKAATEFLADSRAIIRGFQKADVSSASHEFAHVFRRDLSPELLKGAEDALGVKGGNWTKPHEEQFARGFERYLKTGIAPDVRLRRVFEAFKSWLTEIYGAVRGKNHPLRFKPNPELIAVFDKALGGLPKGEQGQFIHRLYKADAPEGTPFFDHPQVKRALRVPQDADATQVADALTTELGAVRSSHLTPEKVEAWARGKGLSADVLASVSRAAEGAVKAKAEADEPPPLMRPEPSRPPTRYEQTGVRQSRYDPSTASLSEAVRALGGLRITDDNRGEMRHLNQATTGLTRRQGGMGADEMIVRLKEDGFFGWDEDVTTSDFLSMLEDDATGGRKVYSNQREVDYEELYRREHPEESEEALISLLETEEGGRLFDNVEQGQATRREVEEFRRLAREAGVFPEQISAILRAGREASKGVPDSVRAETREDFNFKDDPLDDDTSILFQPADPRQMGLQQVSDLELLTQAGYPPRRGETREEIARAARSLRYDQTKAKIGGENMLRFEELHDPEVDAGVRAVAREMYKRIEAGRDVPENLPDILTTLNKLHRLRQSRTPVRDYLRQDTLFGEKELTPTQESLLAELDANPKRVIERLLPAEKSPVQDVLFQPAHNDRRTRAYRALVKARHPDLYADMQRPVASRTRMGARRSKSLEQQALSPDLAPPLKRPTKMETLADIANVPRTLKSSIDLSAAGRQGLKFATTHPAKAIKIFFGDQMRALRSKGFEDFKGRLQADPDAKLMLDSELYLASLKDDSKPTEREEAFASKLASRIPLVKQSNQAYVAFLDAARSAWFKQLARQAEAKGKPTPDEYKAIARFVNIATGRGDFGKGKVNDALPVLNAIFFAPRYTASKIQALDPRVYARLPQGARRMAMRQAVQHYATLLAVVGLAKLGEENLGVTVESDDPKSADFGKVRRGNTRFDLSAGDLQYVNLVARIFESFEDDKKTAVDSLKRWARYKLAPIPAAAINLDQGKDAIGQKTTLGKEAVNLIAPIYLKDLWDAYKEEGAAGMAKNAPAFIGVGVNTYKEREKKPEARKTPTRRGRSSRSKRTVR